jgi:hypothetical protein
MVEIPDAVAFVLHMLAERQYDMAPDQSVGDRAEGPLLWTCVLYGFVFSRQSGILHSLSRF